MAAGLLSSVEDRWRQAAKAAEKGADLAALRAVDPDLVERESWLLGSALRQVAEELPEGGRDNWQRRPETPGCARRASRLLTADSVRLMTSDHTTGAQREIGRLFLEGQG